MNERLQATESWRAQRRPGLDPQVKRMGLVAGGVAAALVVLGGGYSLLAGRSHGVPVIEADSRPLRVKPADPGGMQVVGANEQIMNGEGDGKADKMAPPPEAPQLGALRAQVQAAREADKPSAPVAPQPAPPPAQTVALNTRAPAEGPTAPKPDAAKPVAPSVQAAGGVQVQLAAVETEAQANTEWTRLSRKMPELFASRHPLVVKAERDGKLLYRLRMGGFTDIAQATAFCTQMKSKGAGCAIANF